MSHECRQSEKIRAMELDMAVAKSDIKNVKDDIKEVKCDVKEIKQSQKEVSSKIDKKFHDLTWWIIGLLISISGTLAYLVYNNSIGG